jgi:hypothetical protein
MTRAPPDAFSGSQTVHSGLSGVVSNLAQNRELSKARMLFSVLDDPNLGQVESPYFRTGAPPTRARLQVLYHRVCGTADRPS